MLVVVPAWRRCRFLRTPAWCRVSADAVPARAVVVRAAAASARTVILVLVVMVVSC
jgi:hypothetical protein